MQSVKAFAIALLAAASIAVFAAPPASAESTSLCKVHENPCAEANIQGEVHATLTSGEIWLLTTSVENVSCSTVLLHSAGGALGTPLFHSIDTLTFEGCEVEEAKKPTKCEVVSSASVTTPIHANILKTALNLADVTLTDGKLTVKCGFFIICTYALANYPYHFEGATVGSHGMIETVKAALTRERGICPEASFITSSLLEPLTDTYIVG